MSANVVVLFGNAGKDPVCNRVGENSLVAEFSMATSEPPRVKGGEWTTTWHNLKAWGKTAEKIEAKLRKGDRVAIVGKIEVEQWEKDGQQRYKTIIKVKWPEDIVIEPKTEAGEEY